MIILFWTDHLHRKIIFIFNNSLFNIYSNQHSYKYKYTRYNRKLLVNLILERIREAQNFKIHCNISRNIKNVFINLIIFLCLSYNYNSASHRATRFFKKRLRIFFSSLQMRKLYLKYHTLQITAEIISLQYYNYLNIKIPSTILLCYVES